MIDTATTTSENRYVLPESAIWLEGRECWAFVDILDSKVYVGDNYVLEGFTNPSLVVESESGNIIVLSTNGLTEVNLSNELKQTNIIDFSFGNEFRCNDGCIGPDGQIWFGTMQHQPTGLNGDVYSYSVDKGLIKHNAPIGIPNTFIWLDKQHILISDSYLQQVFKVPLSDSGYLDWGGKVLWLDLKYLADNPDGGTPDGGTIDAEGNIWIAIWGAACLHKYSPEGDLLDRIPLRALQPTSCAFSQKDHGVLMITTATAGLSKGQLEAYPDTGKVLFLRVNSEHNQAKNGLVLNDISASKVR